MSCIFPEDIFEEIIGHPTLGNQTKTFASCSLVCRSWVGHSRRHLFKDVRLYSGVRVQSFATLFVSPHCTIGSHIQNVEVKMDGSDAMAVSEAIQAVATHVQTCHRLSISPFSWTNFPVSTRNTFLRLGTVDDLELFEVQCGSLHELVAIIRCFPRLLGLTLKDGIFNRHVLPSTMSLPSSLTRLSLAGSGYTSLHPFLAMTVLPNLSTMKISLTPKGFSNISSRLKRHASTLEHVRIAVENLPAWNIGSTLMDAWSLLDFSGFGALKTLLLDFDPYEAGIDHFKVIAAILGQIPSSSLTSLEVFCTARLSVHHSTALPVLQKCVNTLNEPRFATMRHPKVFHARLTFRTVILSQMKIYCNNEGDFEGYWTSWLMEKIHDPHKVLDVINC